MVVEPTGVRRNVNKNKNRLWIIVVCTEKTIFEADYYTPTTFLLLGFVYTFKVLPMIMMMMMWRCRWWRHRRHWMKSDLKLETQCVCLCACVWGCVKTASHLLNAKLFHLLLLAFVRGPYTINLFAALWIMLDIYVIFAIKKTLPFSKTARTMASMY